MPLLVFLKQVERRREQERVRQLEEKQLAFERKTAMEAVGSFTIAKQVGEGDAIFGTVTDREVAAVIQENYWSGSGSAGD